MAEKTPPKEKAIASGPTLVAWGFFFFILTIAGFIGMELVVERMAAPPTDATPPVDPQTLRISYYALMIAVSITGFLAAVYTIAGGVRLGHYSTGSPSAGAHAANESQMMQTLQSINNRMLVSEQAKRIVSRERDRDALRSAIREDIDKGDFEAALVLADEMSDTYGYREEAEQFREEIVAAREAYVQRKVTEAIAGLDQMLANHQWHRALLEAGKIQRLYHDSPKVHGLEKYVRDSFQQYKQSLGNQFTAAFKRDDVELCMDLMKEMDKYLTEAEAARYKEMAREVVSKKRDNLGVQWRMAVQDKEWGRALRVSQQIIDQFPNTKMATEVKGKLPDLQQLAQQQTANA